MPVVANDEISLREAAHIVPRPVLQRAINDGSLTLHRRRRVFYISRADVECLRTLHEKPTKPQQRSQ